MSLKPFCDVDELLVQPAAWWQDTALDDCSPLDLVFFHLML
jgi:hypothetical protein